MAAEKRFLFAKWFPVKPRPGDEVPVGLHPALAELCRLQHDRSDPEALPSPSRTVATVDNCA